MNKKALNLIMGIIMAGSIAIAFASETPSETAGWSVAAIACAIFLVEKIKPNDNDE